MLGVTKHVHDLGR